MTFSRYDRYVDRHARSFIERLQAICRMPSVAARGTGMRAMGEAVEQMMQRVGIGTRSFRMGAGYPIIYRFTKEHADLLIAEGCIWDEGYRDTKERPVVSLGFKGITFLELWAHGARTDLHSKWGAIVPNPAWRLVQALSTITSPKGVITIDRFSSHIAPISDEDLQALQAIELD